MCHNPHSAPPLDETGVLVVEGLLVVMAFPVGLEVGGGYLAGRLALVMEPSKQWLRLGSSYSHSMGQKISLSIRWGASPIGGGKYIRQIPSPTMQRFNQYLRGKSLPLPGWRARDAGHFHLKR